MWEWSPRSHLVEWFKTLGFDTRGSVLVMWAYVKAQRRSENHELQAGLGLGLGAQSTLSRGFNLLGDQRRTQKRDDRRWVRVVVKVRGLSPTR